METVAPLGSTYQAGTLSGNPLAMAAGIATLDVLGELGVYEELEGRAQQLCQGLVEAALGAGVPATLNRVGAMMTLFFCDGPVTDFTDAKRADTALYRALLAPHARARGLPGALAVRVDHGVACAHRRRRRPGHGRGAVVLRGPLGSEPMARPVDKSAVPAVTVPRLTVYLRKLRELQARGTERVSSKQLAGLIDLNAAQIRKDFSYFGEFGRRGVGYEVDRLVTEIKRCLGLERSWNVIIVGAGSLGTALARYRGFAEQGFKLVGMFDSSQRKVGVSYGDGRTIRDAADLESFCHEEHVDIAIVSVPAHAAQSIIDRLVGLEPPQRVHAILNFAPVKVFAPRDVIVRQVDFSSELMFLSFYLDREA